MFQILTILALLAAAGGFIYAAWSDFREWRIPNLTVLFLVFTYAVFAFASAFGGAGWPATANMGGGLAAGALLFAIGFVLWFVKMLGAGDAKLMLPVGLFVGWANLLPFALSLILSALAAMLLLKLPLPAGLSATWTGMRIDEIRRTRKVPYGVVLVVAVFAVYAFTN